MIGMSYEKIIARRRAMFTSFEDSLSDRLAEAVESFNSENDPAERVRLFGSIRALRAKLTVHPAPGTRENFEHGGAQ